MYACIQSYWIFWQNYIEDDFLVDLVVTSIVHLYTVLCTMQHVVHWGLRNTPWRKQETFCLYGILWVKKKKRETFHPSLYCFFFFANTIESLLEVSWHTNGVIPHSFHCKMHQIWQEFTKNVHILLLQEAKSNLHLLLATTFKKVSIWWFYFGL